MVPLYILRNECGDVLSGKFHGNQLVKINIKAYRSYPVSERNTKKGKEYKMRFIGYNEDYDESIPASKMVDI